eukprot:1962353-Rhodomonas_salina.1
MKLGRHPERPAALKTFCIATICNLLWAKGIQASALPTDRRVSLKIDGNLDQSFAPTTYCITVQNHDGGALPSLQVRLSAAGILGSF